MRVCVGVALLVEGRLPLAHHAEHLIVENYRDDGQVVADGSAGLVQVHVERAVARQHDDAGISAQRHLCADGRAVAEAHCAQTAAGQEAAGFRVVQILRCPHLVLADVGDVNGLGACLIADLINDLVRLQLGVAVRGLVVVLLPAADLLHPELVLGLFDVGQNGLQNVAGVAGQA